MTTNDSTTGERGLYATLAVALIVVTLLAVALFRPRAPRQRDPELPRESVLLLDEPVETYRPQSLPPSQ